MPPDDKPKDPNVEPKKDDDKGIESFRVEGKEYKFSDLLQVLRYLRTENQELKGKLDDLANDDQRGGRGSSDDDGDRKPASIDADTIEKMDRAQFAEWLTDRIVGTVEQRIGKPFHERLTGIEDGQQRMGVRGEVKEAMGKYADFSHFQADIQAVLKENPEMSVDDAYHVAKGRNPERVQELDEAARKAAEEKAAQEKKERESDFGGLLPTSGRAVRNEALSAKDAAEAAWNETIAGTPAETLARAE